MKCLLYIYELCYNICGSIVAPKNDHMLLTEALIKDTEFNPTKRITLTDGGGLQLRITKTDKRSWSLQYRFHGSMKKLTLIMASSEL